MGDQLDEAASQHMDTAHETMWDVTLAAPALASLDGRSAALVRAVTAAVAEYPEAQALILFGSVARHDERPVADAEPSDVDLLLLVDPGAEAERLPVNREVSLRITIGRLENCYRDAPREVQITIAERDLSDWDPLFVANVARDGILLWSRGPLPAPLAAVSERARAGASLIAGDAQA